MNKISAAIITSIASLMAAVATYAMDTGPTIVPFKTERVSLPGEGQRIIAEGSLGYLPLSAKDREVEL
ncbi:MAG: hypothetical protein KJS73_00890 [Gammaproteobacteria bacterium]|nr:hypothetical protein [Gammaproteobacteria bacterium]